jgi:hypothetical protein
LFIIPHVPLSDLVPQECRDIAVPYPTAQEVHEQLRFYNRPDSFRDLYTKDFIMVSGRVARRQLCHLDLKPYSTRILMHGLDHMKTKESTTVSLTLLEGMEYSAMVGTMVSMEVADLSQKVDQIEEIAVEASKDVEEASETRKEMMELGAEMMECRGAMMMMRNALTDAIREFQDAKVDWIWESDLLIQIQTGLLCRLEAVERQVGPRSRDRPIVIKDSEDSGNNGGSEGMETVPRDEISLWARNVADSAYNTLVNNQIVYELVLIKELGRSK